MYIVLGNRPKGVNLDATCLCERNRVVLFDRAVLPVKTLTPYRLYHKNFFLAIVCLHDRSVTKKNFVPNFRVGVFLFAGFPRLSGFCGKVRQTLRPVRFGSLYPIRPFGPFIYILIPLCLFFNTQNMETL